MSYLLFGCISGEYDLDKYHDIQCILKYQAVKSGFNIFVDEQIPQEIVVEMLNEQTDSSSKCMFLITLQSNEDTSDTMISPYECSWSQIGEVLTSIEDWSGHVLNAIPTLILSLFFTEGYEAIFVVQNMSLHGWSKTLTEIFSRKGDIPSLRINLKFHS
jgi:hypothetical protein